MSWVLSNIRKTITAASIVFASTMMDYLLPTTFLVYIILVYFPGMSGVRADTYVPLS